MRTFFGEALAAAQANDAPLAVRLAINPNAAELHSLRWETLRLPDSDAPLLTGENLRFSRYLSSLDWRPVRLRPQADLRALVVVASPSNAAKWQLAEVKTEDELAAARAGLGDITDHRAGDARPGHPEQPGRAPARRLRHPLPGGARHPGGRRAADPARAGGRHGPVDARPRAGHPHLRAAGAAAAGGAGLLPERRDGRRTDHAGRRRAGRARPTAGRGGRAGGDRHAGQPDHEDGGGLHAGLFRRAAARRPGGSGHGRGARRRARPPRLVDAGALHAPAQRPHRLQPRLWRREGRPAQVAGARAQHPGRALHADHRARRQRVAAGLAARDRRALGGELRLSHGPQQQREPAAGRPVPGGRPGHHVHARRAGQAAARRGAAALRRSGCRPARPTRPWTS